MTPPGNELAFITGVKFFKGDQMMENIVSVE